MATRIRYTRPFPLRAGQNAGACLQPGFSHVVPTRIAQMRVKAGYAEMVDEPSKNSKAKPKDKSLAALAPENKSVAVMPELDQDAEFEAMTKPELIEELANHGIEASMLSRKQTLIDKLKEARK